MAANSTCVPQGALTDVCVGKQAYGPGLRDQARASLSPDLLVWKRSSLARRLRLGASSIIPSLMALPNSP